MPEPQNTFKLLALKIDGRRVVVTVKNQSSNMSKCYVMLFFSAPTEAATKPQATDVAANDPKKPNGEGILYFNDAPQAWLDTKEPRLVDVLISLTDPEQAQSVDQPPSGNTSMETITVNEKGEWKTSETD